MPVSHQHRCIFVHIPKCAGTSIEAALGMHGELDHVGLRPNYNQTLNEETLFGAGAQHYCLNQIRERIGEEAYAGYFKFSIVRNPWDRFVSYVAWKADRDGRMKWLAGKPPSRREFYEALWALIVDHVRGRPVHMHLRPQWEFLADADGEIGVDFVGRVETLEADWSRIRERLGIDAPLERRMQSSHLDYRKYYDPLSRLAIGLVYRRDIALFGYRFRGLK